STPVQAGNSGGALVDKSANVIGVVASKLNVLRVLQATGDVPQNVNFAVSLEALRLFLNRAGIAAQEAASLTSLSAADVGEKAQKFTFLIICEGTPDLTREATQGKPNATGKRPGAVDDRWVVVVASLRTRIEALKVFADIQQSYSDVLSGRTPDVMEVDLGNKGIFFRLILGPPGPQDAAGNLCRRLKVTGVEDFLAQRLPAYAGCSVTRLDNEP